MVLTGKGVFNFGQSLFPVRLLTVNVLKCILSVLDCFDINVGGIAMKYCSQCGRQLQDGEVCTCQAVKVSGGQQENVAFKATSAQQTEKSQSVQSQEKQETQKQQNTQGQQASVQETSKRSVGSVINKVQSARLSQDMLAYVKHFLKNPLEASESVVGEQSFMMVVGLVVVSAALSLIYIILSMIIEAAKGRYFTMANWVMGILRPIIWWVVIPVAFASLIWLCAKYVEGKNVSFKKAFSVFAIPALLLLVLTALNILAIVFSHPFFEVIFGVVRAAAAGGILYLTGFGISKVIPVSRKFVYSVSIICAGLYFANWLVTQAIF